MLFYVRFTYCYISNIVSEMLLNEKLGMILQKDSCTPSH